MDRGVEELPIANAAPSPTDDYEWLRCLGRDDPRHTAEEMIGKSSLPLTPANLLTVAPNDPGTAVIARPPEIL